MKLAELADRIGLPVRQVRYMIAEDIMPGADGTGRYADGFGERHLEIGLRYKAFHDQGHSLQVIKHLLLAGERLEILRHGPVTLAVDPASDPRDIDLDATLAAVAEALRRHVNQDKE